jgi:hypothetical protein
VCGIAEASGPSLIFAGQRRTNPLGAALVNGNAAHALDYDDESGVLGGHPRLPMTREELWENFSDCAGRSVTRDNVMLLFEALGNSGELMHLLKGDIR